MALYKLDEYYPNYEEIFDGHDIQKFDVYAQGDEKVGDWFNIPCYDFCKARCFWDMRWGYLLLTVLQIGGGSQKSKTRWINLAGRQRGYNVDMISSIALRPFW